MKLLERQRGFLLQICRVAQGGPRGPKRGIRQLQDALWRAGSQCDAGGAETAVEQELREEAAEGMADDDRGLIEASDDLVVMIDNVRDSDPSERRRISA